MCQSPRCFHWWPHLITHIHHLKLGLWSQFSKWNHVDPEMLMTKPRWCDQRMMLSRLALGWGWGLICPLKDISKNTKICYQKSTRRDCKLFLFCLSFSRCFLLRYQNFLHLIYFAITQHSGWLYSTYSEIFFSSMNAEKSHSWNTMLYKAKQGPCENLWFKAYIFSAYLASTLCWHCSKPLAHILEQKQQISLASGW